MSNTRFSLVEYEDASPEVKEIYDDILQFHRFVPNWYKCQATSPGILKGNWEKIKATLFSGEIPLVLKQMILLSTSRAKGCEYCIAVHTHALSTLSAELGHGNDIDFSQNLDNPLIPSSYRVAVKVVTRIALDPLKTSSADFEELADEGFSNSEIQELIAQADLANFVNTFAEISGLPLDKEIAELI